MSSTSFSQGLTPAVQVTDGDTSFCFSISQAKTIARHLTKSVYCDTLLDEQGKEKALLRQAIAKNDSTISTLEEVVDNYESIVKNNDKITGNFNQIIDQKDKQLRKLKFHRFGLSVLVIVITILAII